MLPTEILDVIPEGIIMFTGDQMKSLELVWLNQTARETMEKTRKGLVGAPIPPNFLVFDKNDQAQVIEALTKRASFGNETVDFVDGDGGAISGHMTFTPFAFDGRPVKMAAILKGQALEQINAVVGEIEDTEQRQLAIIQTRQEAKEERIRYIEMAVKNIELERLHREKEDAIGMVAHDLKNPLSSIHLMLSKIERYRDRMTAEQINETVQRTLMTINNMSDTVSSLVTVHKMESKEEPFNYMEIDARLVVDDVIGQMRPIATQKQIDLILETAESALFIHVDPSQLSRILINLVSNAVKFSHPDTTITITITPRPHTVEISVTDEGQGLTTDDFKKIFAKFGKLSARPTADEHSTGLGLYISKQLTTVMGGQIKAFSQGRNRGSTFTLTFDTISAPQS